MKKQLSAAMLTLVLLTNGAQAAEQTAKIAVGELSCPSCVFIASTSMKALPTVAVLGFDEGENRWEGVFTVSYDDLATSPEKLVEAVQSNGYPASVVGDGES